MDLDFNDLDFATIGGRNGTGNGSGSGSGTIAASIAESTTDKAYRILTASGNITSYSKLAALNVCPRKYEMDQLEANSPVAEAPEQNADFAFGHAVGAGIQTYAATMDLEMALFAGFTSWKLPADFVQIKTTTRMGKEYHKETNKSLDEAMWAIEQFPAFYDSMLGEWEILVLPSGKPAVELSFGIDFKNGFYHYGHIDCILQHKFTKQLAVWEGKTTGSMMPKESSYGNSAQALGYSVIVDYLSKMLKLPAQNYEVFYIVWTTESREYLLMPFTKTATAKAEWLMTMQLEQDRIKVYSNHGLFPKNGNACTFQFGRECKWYGTCQYANDSVFPGVVIPIAADPHAAHETDLFITVDDLVDNFA